MTSVWNDEEVMHLTVHYSTQLSYWQLSVLTAVKINPSCQNNSLCSRNNWDILQYYFDTIVCRVPPPRFIHIILTDCGLCGICGCTLLPIDRDLLLLFLATYNQVGFGWAVNGHVHDNWEVQGILPSCVPGLGTGG